MGVHAFASVVKALVMQRSVISVKAALHDVLAEANALYELHFQINLLLDVD